MSLYIGSRAKVRYGNDLYTDTIDLNTGVLQGDTLAPNLFVIVLDYILRTALCDESLGLQITFPNTSRRNPRKLATFITDLDFADDIMLTSENIMNAQIMLSAIETTATKVGLNINRFKTEYMVVGNKLKGSETALYIKSGEISKVDDFKYLGSWLLNCEKDFASRRELAWKASIRLVKIWKSKEISREVKVNLFHACVESTLFYNAGTWTMTKTLEKKIDGAYTKLLRYALGYSWKDKISNRLLYDNLPRGSQVVQKLRLRLAGHCYRATDQPVSQLLFWDHSLLSGAGCNRGGMKPNFARSLLKEVGSLAYSKGYEVVDVTDVQNLMCDRDTWRNLIRSIV